jgi:hypothetical protein
MHDKFDELSKALARGVSRRDALKLFGAGLVGSALAIIGRSRASEAANDVDAQCASYCGVYRAIKLRNSCYNACVDCGGSSGLSLQSGQFVCADRIPWNGQGGRPPNP